MRRRMVAIALLDGHDAGMKYLVWDFDGTLAYRDGQWPAWTQALMEVLDREIPGHGAAPELLRPFMRAGFPWHYPEIHHPQLASADAWWETLEPRFADAFAAVGADEASAREMAKAVRRTYLVPERWRLYDDALPALEQLSSRGWKHLLLTNHVPELEEIVRHLCLDRHLHGMFNSAESGYEKPNPRAFDGVLEATAGAEAVWMIGDSVDADVAGAESVGIPAILVRKQHDGVERRCGDLSGISAIVEG